MKKKVTNKDVEDILREAVERINIEYRKDLSVASAMMHIAEELLARTFNEKQKKLYEDFCEKRKIFYHEASKIHVDKFSKNLK